MFIPYAKSHKIIEIKEESLQLNGHKTTTEYITKIFKN